VIYYFQGGQGSDMAVGPFSVTQPMTLQTQPNPTQPTTYVVTRDQTQPNIEQQHNVVQIAKKCNS